MAYGLVSERDQRAVWGFKIPPRVGACAKWRRGNRLTGLYFAQDEFCSLAPN